MTDTLSTDSPAGVRPRTVTIAAAALAVSPICAVAAMALFPDPTDEIAMVQSTGWSVLWALGLAASLLFAVGVTGVFGTRVGTDGDRRVRYGVGFAWLAFVLTALMYGLNVTAARMLVDPASTAVLPAAQQQFGLDMVEATTNGLYGFAVAFGAAAALLLGRVAAGSPRLAPAVGKAGQALGAVTLVSMAVLVVAPGLLGYETVSMLGFVLGILVYVWGLAVGVSVLRGRTAGEPVGEAA